MEGEWNERVRTVVRQIMGDDLHRLFAYLACLDSGECVQSSPVKNRPATALRLRRILSWAASTLWLRYKVAAPITIRKRIVTPASSYVDVRIV